MTTALSSPGGRANQKARTRAAILEACDELVRSGAEVTMPEVAARALVSEATAYRYFPDLISLLQEALEGLWPAAAQALAPVADSRDPVERVTFACEYLLRGVHAYQGAVRAMISYTITAPAQARARPGIRFGLIDYALAPFAAPGQPGPPARRDDPPQAGPRRRAQRRGVLRAHRPVRARTRRRDRQRRPDRGRPHPRGLRRVKPRSRSRSAE